MYKKFTDWIGLKEKLHEKMNIVPRIHEGDIWWASLGENIGWEINGKSKDFTRPVIIYKKLAHGFYFVIPATTKTRSGTWYVHYRYRSTDAIACIHQARAIDYRRFYSKVGELDNNNFQRIKAGFAALYL
ncbi:MAG: type II toxin-antitoxin system PemK/MazF family toxin [Candidatus Peregrinibacteria bacterium]|nr:type II toxin-antitoxin system PemK/MazF family toxin [Candidatus Peregrinibacteria bacterium]